MSAKARAISITGQQTPVIIKVGGDAAGLYNDQSNVESPVSIDSPVMTFRENIPGPTWKRAESTRKGRLRELTIVNGDEQQDFPITPDSQLASITLQYGLDELVIREIGDAHNNNVSLEFVSDQVPFTATREPDWNDASATFPQAVTGVVFKQGETVVVQQRYRVPNIRLTFSIDYRRNEPQ